MKDFLFISSVTIESKLPSILIGDKSFTLFEIRNYCFEILSKNFDKPIPLYRKMITNSRCNRTEFANYWFSLSIFSHVAFSQEIDSTKSIEHFDGAVTVTNNGIFLLPSFSLGEPSAYLICIETNIPGSDFVWNVGVIYSVRNEFVKK